MLDLGFLMLDQTNSTKAHWALSLRQSPDVIGYHEGFFFCLSIEELSNSEPCKALEITSLLLQNGSSPNLVTSSCDRDPDAARDLWETNYRHIQSFFWSRPYLLGS